VGSEHLGNGAAIPSDVLKRMAIKDGIERRHGVV
jgi:hypothetical protein